MEKKQHAKIFVIASTAKGGFCVTQSAPFGRGEAIQLKMDCFAVTT